MPLSNAEGLAQRERGTTGRLSGQFNRFCSNTPCRGLQSWNAIKMSAARRTHTLCLMVLIDGILR